MAGSPADLLACSDDDEGRGTQRSIEHLPESSGLYYVNIDNGKAANSDDFGPSEAGTYTLSADDITDEMGAG